MNKNKLTLAIYGLFYTACASANLPQNGKVIIGEASINTHENNMTINQNSARVNIDWESFNIGKNNQVEFKQPDSKSIAYNRVTGGNASQIQGKLQANGRVFLANPNGVIFSKDAQVNVGSLLATTKELENPTQNLDKDSLKFVRKKAQEGKVENHGTIKAKGENGFVILAGDQVVNTGKIEAENYYKHESKTKTIRYCDDWYGDYACEMGWQNWENRTVTEETTIDTPAQVILASGENFTVELDDNSVYVDLDANTLAGLIENKGAIIAQNGYIELTAKGKEAVLDSAINNDGLLQATHVSQNAAGKITLSAPSIQLNEKSDIKADKLLSFTSPADETRQVNIDSKKGSKITAQTTEIKNLDKFKFTGTFERDDSDSFYSSSYEKQANRFDFNLKGKITIGSQYQDEKNFISGEALSAMLSSSERVTLFSNPTYDPNKREYDFGGIGLSGNIRPSIYKNSDSTLLLKAMNNIDINHANIDTQQGRLYLAMELLGRDAPRFGFVNSRINLNKGSWGLEHGGIRYYDYGSNLEEEARTPFTASFKDISLENVDDLVINGFDKLEMDGLKSQGRTNFYLNGGYANQVGNATRYVYAFKKDSERSNTENLIDRLMRSNKEHGYRRWAFSTDVEKGVKREFVNMFDLWAEPYSHLDTEINIKNSLFNINDGFVHLMAKNIHLTNSNFNLDYDRDISLDSTHANINKFGLNGNVVLDNSHIKVVGAEKTGVSPNPNWGAAGFFLVGDLLGKNQSSIYVKQHTGYGFRTDTNNQAISIRGETGPKDLSIKVVSTAGAARADVSPTNGPIYDDADAGFAATNPKGTSFVNTTVEFIAPNGAPAYLGGNGGYGSLLSFENSDVSFFEQPRVNNLNAVETTGSPMRQLSRREMLQALDRLNGISPSNLSSSQLGQIADQQAVFENQSLVEGNTEEKVVNLEVCSSQDKDQCESITIGDKNSQSRVSVGEIN
ncbi:hypothetical protein A4G20_03400 [Pasteurellaceae bacterium RH1A]|nr:hypothetical protein A4G20_03400 [Pasteurellaceae bacterium RH1A]